ncbi:hypothetical protein F4604DRAFT_1672139 [Suillus subluteus]|nr:hypothetical protein F4604DRAFT_1672139 [Suillus subluteus]
MSQNDSSVSPTGTNLQQDDRGIQQLSEASQTLAETAPVQAQQRRRIAELEGQIETLESGQTNFYLAQGRAIRQVITLFDGIDNLVAENDRRYEADDDKDTTLE